MEYVNIRIQDQTGDRKLRLSWDPGDTKAAKEAQERMKEMFYDLKDKGYKFYECKKVLGLFPKKGKEVNYYDASKGELIYEEDKNIKRYTQLEEMESVNRKIRYEESKTFEPKEQKVDTSKDYLVTNGLRAG